MSQFFSMVIFLAIVYLLVNPKSVAANAITFLSDSLSNTIRAAVTGA